MSFILTNIIMNYLYKPTEKLLKRININNNPKKITIDSFDHLDIYININPIINFLQSYEEYKLKNLWNFTIYNWHTMINSNIHNHKFKKSEYNISYKYIYDNLLLEEFNHILNLFIEKNYMKGLFVINCICKYIYPK